MKTKLLGTAPDERHPLAPPEIIYAVEVPVPLKRLNLAGWLFTATMLAMLGFVVLGQFVEISDVHRLIAAAIIVAVMLALCILGPQRINLIAPYVRAGAKSMRSPLWARVLFPIMFAFFAYMIFRAVTESTPVELAWLAAALAYFGLLYWASWRIKRIRYKHRRYQRLASFALLVALMGGYWLLLSLRDGWLP